MVANQWHLDGELKFTVGQYSSAGKKPENEDSIGIRIPKGMLMNTKGAVAIIADGVSASEAGKEASETCVFNFLSDYYSTPDSWSVKKSTSQVLNALNRWLYGKGQQFVNAQRGYVSTLSCVVFKSQTAHLFHIGDTRIYRLRRGELEQLTRDHATPINNQQTYLTRAIGLDVRADVDYRAAEMEVGDVFLLTTDGVHDFVTNADIIGALNSGDAYDQSCEKLASLALKNNSHDNLSCQILRVDELPTQNVEDVYQKLTDLPFPPHLEKGMVIDGYQVEREIHASSRSQLYIVKDTESNKRYCMKTPSVNYEDDPAYIERFRMESWIGSRIHSPYIVNTINNDRKKTFLYYLTEYIDGKTLERWIKENPKPAIQDVTYLVEQVAKGVRAFHRRDIFHQDLKPANILIDTNGEAKIIDFGSCHVQGIAEISTPLERDVVLGTASYSAPEVVLRGAVTSQADIFSLGVIVFEMCTGVQPFEGKLAQCRSENAYLRTKYISAFELNPMVPVWMDGAIKKALRYDPNRRYADIDEFVHELTHPNPKYKRYHEAPMMARNPLLFWQVTSALLFVALCVCLYFLVKS